MKEIVKKLNMIQDLIRSNGEYTWHSGVDFMSDDELINQGLDMNWIERQLHDVIVDLTFNMNKEYKRSHQCYRCNKYFTLPQTYFTPDGKLCRDCMKGDKK